MSSSSERGRHAYVVLGSASFLFPTYVKQWNFWFTSEPAEDPNLGLTCLLSHLFMAFASHYVARDNVSSGATPDAYASFHVTNVVVPPLVRGCEKDELQ
jgi:hypothetical protein